jgi:hypothetical protein
MLSEFDIQLLNIKKIYILKAIVSKCKGKGSQLEGYQNRSFVGRRHNTFDLIVGKTGKSKFACTKLFLFDKF